MPSIIGMRITTGISPQQYANESAQLFGRLYTSLPNDPKQILKALSRSKTNENIKLMELFEKFKKYMLGTLHFDDPAIAEPMNDLVENDAYEFLERVASHKLTNKGKKSKLGEKAIIAYAILEVMAAYKKMTASAKPILEAVLPDLKEMRPVANRVLRQASGREEHTQKANEALKAVGITDKEFNLNDTYLFLLAKVEDKSSVLTKEENTVLSQYTELEKAALNKLKENKIAKQSYNYYKKMALGMEKLRRESLKEYHELDKYNKSLIEQKKLDFEYNLLGQYPWPVI